MPLGGLAAVRELYGLARSEARCLSQAAGRYQLSSLPNTTWAATRPSMTA
jgi:hypothetical protein